jgi:ferredoxin
VTATIDVDPRRCVASQTCVRIAPKHFELVDHTHARSTGAAIADDELEQLYDAEESCPTGAIRVVVTEGSSG